MRFLPALIIAVLLAACEKTIAKTAAQLRADIQAAAEGAEASVETSDAAAAEAAASAATTALDQLRKLHAQARQPEGMPVDDALLTECQTAALKAGRWASLTKEKVARQEKLAGWKAKACYALDAAVWKVFIHSFAFAADQAADGNLAVLPEKVQESARQAVSFAESFVGPQRLASGEVDWRGVSRALRQIPEMPAEMRLLMAFLMMAGLEFDGAFFELESINEQSLKTPEHRASHLLLLGFSHLSQGYGQLAMRELEQADKLSTGEKLNLDPGGKCCLHLLVAGYFLHEKRWSDADRCLAAANRAWPDNPAITYLTGERQIAAHEYAAAEESFAKASHGSGFEWLAEKVAARARRLRDNPADLEPVVFDFNFMAEIASHCLKEEAKKSATVRRLQEQMEAARSFMRDLKQKLPEVEMKMPEWKKLFESEAKPASDKK